MRNSKPFIPRKNRIDIKQNLPIGAFVLLAENHKCTKGYVSFVLSGYKKDSSEKAIAIIKEAELMAAVNIWKNRFCKFESLL